jgi:hypothetical protein
VRQADTAPLAFADSKSEKAKQNSEKADTAPLAFAPQNSEKADKRKGRQVKPQNSKNADK